MVLLYSITLYAFTVHKLGKCSAYKKIGYNSGLWASWKSDWNQIREKDPDPTVKNHLIWIQPNQMDPLTF